MTVIGAPRGDLGETAAFTILRVMSTGVNNLPTNAAMDVLTGIAKVEP